MLTITYWTVYTKKYSERLASEENEEFIPMPNLVGSQSFLTLKEEENLLNFIKKRKDSLQ